MKNVFLIIPLTILLNACTTAPVHFPIKGSDEYIAGDHGIDQSGFYTQEEIDTCQVIVASNADACDPDNDLKNGDFDAAE